MKKNSTEKIPLLPTLLTTGNLVCGLFAIKLAMNDAVKLVMPPPDNGGPVSIKPFVPYITSCYLILLAMVFDMLDGMVARLTKTDGKFGIEYDSLSDVVSFGVAPAILMYLAVLRYLGPVGMGVAALYAFAGAFRLARFNVNAVAGNSDPKNFIGLPIPAAASVVASYVVFMQWSNWYYANGTRIFYQKSMEWYAENIDTVQHFAIPALMTLLAVLMISTVKFPSLKYYVAREKFRFVGLATLIAVGLVLLLKYVEVTIFLLCTGYVLWGLLWAGIKLFKKKKLTNKQ